MTNTINYEQIVNEEYSSPLHISHLNNSKLLGNNFSQSPKHFEDLAIPSEILVSHKKEQISQITAFKSFERIHT